MAITDKINLNFHHIPTGDPTELVIVDTSIWGALENRPSIIEVTVPGSTVPVILELQKNQVKIYKSNNLRLSPDSNYINLPDGLYKVTIKGSPDTNVITKYIQKTDKLRSDLAQIYLKLDIYEDLEDKQEKQDIQDIKLLIESSEILAGRGRIEESSLRLKEAKRRVDRYINCETCD